MATMLNAIPLCMFGLHLFDKDGQCAFCDCLSEEAQEKEDLALLLGCMFK